MTRNERALSFVDNEDFDVMEFSLKDEDWQESRSRRLQGPRVRGSGLSPARVYRRRLSLGPFPGISALSLLGGTSAEDILEGRIGWPPARSASKVVLSIHHNGLRPRRKYQWALSHLPICLAERKR